MTEQVQIPINTLDAVTVRAVEHDDERLYLLRFMDIHGVTVNYQTTQAGIEAVRQEIERAMLSSMFG